ncbi:hypothetical protein [Neisseria dentiae]|uniref:hypothetical protein n=1 Tax=Neisseria dentiae TaxID=194197 RepID=UPI00211C9077|nr:hypothetical protein [Neisseria dentiae]
MQPPAGACNTVALRTLFQSRAVILFCADYTEKAQADSKRHQQLRFTERLPVCFQTASNSSSGPASNPQPVFHQPDTTLVQNHD